MKNIIEKQILEWKEELEKQVKIRNNAQQVLNKTNETILRIDGGIQANEILLKKIEQESLPTGTVELSRQVRKEQSN